MSKRIEDVFLQEKLTEIGPVVDGDNIMGVLSPGKAKVWEEIVKMNADGAEKVLELMRLERDLLKLKKRFESRQFLFWDEIEQKDERYETAASRGKMLAVKKDDDGSLVVVEFDAPKPSLSDFFAAAPPPPEDPGDE